MPQRPKWGRGEKLQTMGRSLAPNKNQLEHMRGAHLQTIGGATLQRSATHTIPTNFHQLFTPTHHPHTQNTFRMKKNYIFLLLVSFHFPCSRHIMRRPVYQSFYLHSVSMRLNVQTRCRMLHGRRHPQCSLL